MKMINNSIKIDIEVRKHSWKVYSEFKKKHSRATFWHIFLNVISLFLIAWLIFANLWAIRWNTISFDPTIKVLFFVGVILNAIAALLTTFISFFELRPKSKALRGALIDMDNEYKLWKKQEGQYKNSDADIVIIDTINEITRRTS